MQLLGKQIIYLENPKKHKKRHFPMEEISEQ